MKKIEVIEQLNAYKASRGIWNTAVKDSAYLILESLRDNDEVTEEVCLNGADNWKHWVDGGNGLVYYEDIKNAILPPSLRKRVSDEKAWSAYHRCVLQGWLLIKGILKRFK